MMTSHLGETPIFWGMDKKNPIELQEETRYSGKATARPDTPDFNGATQAICRDGVFLACPEHGRAGRGEADDCVRGVIHPYGTTGGGVPHMEAND